MQISRFGALALIVLFLCGCNSEPPIHPVSGTVTLGGKSYERLLIYMDPVEGKVAPYNKGVGETDVTGKMVINSAASQGDKMGLAAGKYKVYFNCWMQKGKAVGLSGEKADDSDKNLETEDIVPAPYNDPAATPVVFEVKSGGENVFEFDIPG